MQAGNTLFLGRIATEYDMKNYADLGGCYPPQPSASADNTLLDLHNSSYHTKAEFNNCFIIFQLLDDWPNLVGDSRLAGISRWLKANQKRRNILNQ